MLLDELRAKKEVIAALGGQYGACHIRVFGSVARGEGQSNALRALLKDEIQRGPDFLRLANALSALYPRASEGKRMLDAMLLAVPR